MSGICAIVTKRNGLAVAGTIAQLSDALKTRAFERVECRFESGAGIGISAGAPSQQFFRGDEITVACDADLSNEPQLKAVLNGDAMSTAGLIAALYRKHGAELVDKLRGSFSAVLWDARQRTLVAFNDPFGSRRLAIYESNDLLLIASRVDALARSVEVDTAINPRAIANVLNFSSNIAPHTILLHVKRMLPGTVLTCEEGIITTRRYWSMQYRSQQKRDEASLSNELESLLQDSVEAHAGEERSVGCFLSGGTDSSTILGMLSRLRNEPVDAFSVGFHEQSFNELYYAKLAATHFRARHHVCFVEPDDCSSALPDIIRSFDEPYGNASAVPTYFCAKLAGEHGTNVLLAGDGGDELFGGNERYATDKIFSIYHELPEPLRRGAIEPLLNCLPEIGLFARGRRYVRRANLPAMDRYFSYHFLSTHQPADVFEPDFLKAMAGYSPLEVPASLYGDAAAESHLDRLLYVDVNITLADNDLPKVVQTSELAGVRSRFPFLDRSVADFSGRLPADLKVKGFKKRYLFKRAFMNLLPVEILKKRKHGFGIPVATWLKSKCKLRDYCQDVLSSRAARERGFFRRDFVVDLIHRNEMDESPYYGDSLWSIFVSELWCQQVLDSRKSVLA